MDYRPGTFFIVPNREQLRKLDCFQQAVFINLCSRADGNGECFPSINSLAEDSGMGRTKVIEVLSQLTKVGFVVKKHRKREDGGLTSNLYQLKLLPELGGSGGGRGVVPTATSNDNQINDKIISQREISSLTDETEVVAVDDNGDELKPRQKKNPEIDELIDHFRTVVKRDVGTRPAVAVSLARKMMNNARKYLEVDEIRQMIDEWTAEGLPDNDTLQITRCLSTNHINKFKVEHDIK